LVGALTLSLTNSYIFASHRAKQVCHFSSLSIFCLGSKTISRRAARRLMVLHPKQTIEKTEKLTKIANLVDILVHKPPVCQ
jgi:hypothetical protein